MYKPLDITSCPAAFLFLFLNAFFRGCTCLKCTIQVGMLTTERKLVYLTVLLGTCLKCTIQARTAPTKQELLQYSSVGALETSAPP